MTTKQTYMAGGYDFPMPNEGYSGSTATAFQGRPTMTIKQDLFTATDAGGEVFRIRDKDRILILPDGREEQLSELALWAIETAARVAYGHPALSPPRCSKGDQP